LFSSGPPFPGTLLPLQDLVVRLAGLLTTTPGCQVAAHIARKLSSVLLYDRADCSPPRPPRGVVASWDAQVRAFSTHFNHYGITTPGYHMAASHLLFAFFWCISDTGFSSHSRSRGNYTINSWSPIWKVPTGCMLSANYDILGNPCRPEAPRFTTIGKIRRRLQKEDEDLWITLMR